MLVILDLIEKKTEQNELFFCFMSYLLVNRSCGNCREQLFISHIKCRLLTVLFLEKKHKKNREKRHPVEMFYIFSHDF